MDRIIEMIDKRILELIKEQGSDTVVRMEELIKLKDGIVNKHLTNSD